MIKRNLPLMITLGVFVLGYLYCLTQFPGFASTRVICNILTDNAFLGIIAVGMTFVILSGGIDLSVGSVIAFTGVFLAKAIGFWGISPLLAFPLVLVMGCAFGAFMGLLIDALNAPASQEFNRLNAAIEEMRQSLMGSVMRVRDASSQIDTGSRELTAGNMNLAQRTESTATSLEQTAASMEEITATVKQNADNAEQAHQMAKTVSDTADHGSEMVCYVIEKMREISGSSARIADILSVIDGIAFQTNILALNASVEAARAGEQ